MTALVPAFIYLGCVVSIFIAAEGNGRRDNDDRLTLRTDNLSDWVITQVIKPSDTSRDLWLGRFATALDEELAAVGSNKNIQKVFIYNISVNPAQELAVLKSPDSTGNDDFGFRAVAVSRRYGILVGAPYHDIGSTL